MIMATPYVELVNVLLQHMDHSANVTMGHPKNSLIHFSNVVQSWSKLEMKLEQLEKSAMIVENVIVENVCVIKMMKSHSRVIFVKR